MTTVALWGLAAFFLYFGPGYLVLSLFPALSGEERIAGATGIGVILFALVEFAAYLTGLPQGAFNGGMLALILLALGTANLYRGTLRRPGRRGSWMAVGAFGFFVHLYALAALLPIYPDFWQYDWCESYQRARFYLDDLHPDQRFPPAIRYHDGRQGEGFFKVPTRKPFYNLSGGFFVSLAGAHPDGALPGTKSDFRSTGGDYPKFQAAGVAMNAGFFPVLLLLALRFFGPRAAVAVGLLLFLHPGFLHYAWFTWPKMPAAYLALLCAHFALRPAGITNCGLRIADSGPAPPNPQSAFRIPQSQKGPPPPGPLLGKEGGPEGKEAPGKVPAAFRPNPKSEIRNPKSIAFLIGLLGGGAVMVHDLAMPFVAGAFVLWAGRWFVQGRGAARPAALALGAFLALAPWHAWALQTYGIKGTFLDTPATLWPRLLPGSTGLAARWTTFRTTFLPESSEDRGFEARWSADRAILRYAEFHQNGIGAAVGVAGSLGILALCFRFATRRRDEVSGATAGPPAEGRFGRGIWLGLCLFQAAVAFTVHPLKVNYGIAAQALTPALLLLFAAAVGAGLVRRANGPAIGGERTVEPGPSPPAFLLPAAAALAFGDFAVHVWGQILLNLPDLLWGGGTTAAGNLSFKAAYNMAFLWDILAPASSPGEGPIASGASRILASPGPFFFAGLALALELAALEGLVLLGRKTGTDFTRRLPS